MKSIARRYAWITLGCSILLGGTAWWFWGQGGIDSRATQLSCALAVLSFALYLGVRIRTPQYQAESLRTLGEIPDASSGAHPNHLVLGDDNRYRGAIRVDGDNHGTITHQGEGSTLGDRAKGPR